MSALSLTERITASFYAWEVRGRGWQLANYPVELEPPFRRCCMLPELAQASVPIDDGKRPTFLSSLADGVRGLLVPESPASDLAITDEPFEEPEPFPAVDGGPLVALRVQVAADFQSSPDIATHLLQALSASLQPISVEFVGSPDGVVMQIVCRETDKEHVIGSLSGYVPEASILEQPDALSEQWQEEDAESVVIDFGLFDEFFLPLALFSSLRIDPYIALLPALGKLSRNECVAFQVLFGRTRNPWTKATLEALTDGEGGSIFADAPDFVPLAKEKLRSTLYSVVLRIAAQGATKERAWELARGTRAFLMHFARPGSNELIPLENEGYADEDHVAALLARQSYRSGMLLSAFELIGLVHLPDASVRHEALERSSARTKALPAVARGHALVLGENHHRGASQRVTVGDEERLQHMHIVGASGTGKSTLLLQLITQDLERGNGIAVLDPHGDLIDEVLGRIPDQRISDVIVFDPSDEAWPIGINVLAATSSIEKQLLASDLVGIFQRLSTSWGDTMGTVLGNAVLAILESESGGTLLDLRRFLIDEDFRKSFLQGVSDEEVQFFWRKEFPLIGTRSVGPILTRLDTFLRSKLIRNIVGQREPRFDFASVIEDRKVFLAKLSQGLVGEESASLLGSLLVTKFHQLALARQRLARSERKPFFMYADEFQHFVTPSMASLLTEGRKYGLGLVLAHQNMYQIRGSPVESALLGNAYTRAVFRVGDEDARRLADGFSFFEGKDLQSLERGQAILRLGAASQDCNVTTLPLSVIDPDIGEERRRAVIERSREAYAVPLEALRRSTSDVVEQASASPMQEASIQQARKTDSPMPARDKAAKPTTIAPSTVATRPRVPLEPSSLGRGGPEHKYLQHLIKRLGEERGFRAIIEETIGSGQSVDVVLRREGVAFAFEISVTSETDHELGNLRKCVGLGYSQLFFVSGSKRKRDQIARAAKDDRALEKVAVLAPEDIVAALDAAEGPMPLESTVRGYKVKINRQSVSYEDVASRRSEIAKIVAHSLGSQASK